MVVVGTQFVTFAYYGTSKLRIDIIPCNIAI